MKNKVNSILDTWFDKYGKNGSAYSDERIVEMATNCVSLSNVWLENAKSRNDMSLNIELSNGNGVACETIYGISVDNLAYSVLDILVNKSQLYSKLTVNAFYYNKDGKQSRVIGELNIS